MKRCPHCGKRVHDETIRCRFCNGLIEPVLPPQQKSEGLWKNHRNLTTIIIIIAIVGLAFLYSKSGKEAGESRHIETNAAKNIPHQAIERNKEESGNDVDQRTRDEYERQQKAKAVKQQEERVKMEQQEHEKQQLEYERQQQKEQQEYEAMQQRKQQQIDREIQAYEREQQRINAEIIQNKQDEIDMSDRKRHHNHRRYRRR